MSVTLNVNGTNYTFPSAGENPGWGAQVTAWATALTQGTLQKAGGAFSLTADANFGATYGLISSYFKSRSSNIAATGAVRLATGDTVSWRDAGNSADLALGAGSSDAVPAYAAKDLVNVDAAQTLTNKTMSGTSNTFSAIPWSAITTTGSNLTDIATRSHTSLTDIGTTTHANIDLHIAATEAHGATGAVVGTTNSQTLTNKTIAADANTISKIANANIDASAAIARSKVATGTAYRVMANTSTGAMGENAALTAAYPVITDANGQLATEQYLDKTRGGTGVTSTATFPASGTITTADSTTTFTNKTFDANGTGNSISNIENADIAAGAAIARSKVATGTAYRVLANASTGALGENAALTASHVIIADANGQLAGEAALAKSRGGAGADMSSVTFPATGTLVTTAAVQALTNKDIDGGTASNTLRLTVPKNTKTNLDGLTRKEATLVYASDTDKLYVDDGSILKAVGSGAGTGELNYITNPSGTDNVAAAAPTPWDLVGDLNLTVTKTAGELARKFLVPSGIKITATSGAQTTADYVYFDFTLDDADLNKMLKITWAQKVLATYAAGQLAVIITTQADRTTALHTPQTTAIPAETGSFGTTFVSGSTATLSLVIRATGEMKTDDGIVLSNIVVGPGSLVQGAASSNPIAWTPTLAGVTGGAATVVGTYHREGKYLHATVRATWATIYTGGTNPRFSLPTGLTIDVAAYPATPVQSRTQIGIGTIHDTGTAAYPAVVLYYDTTNVVVNLYDDDAGTGGAFVRHASIGVTEPATMANGDIVEVSFTVPIAEWSSSIYLASGSDNSVSYLNWTTGGATATNVTLGTGGTHVSYKRRVGDSVEYIGKITIGSATGDVTNSVIIVPTEPVNTAKLPSGAVVGSGRTVDGSGNRYVLSVVTSGADIYLQSNDAASVVNASVPINFTDTDTIEYHFTVPVTGWTAQDYQGKALVGFLTAKVGAAGLVNNDSSNVSGTPIKGATDGSTARAAYVGYVMSGTNAGNVTATISEYINIAEVSLTKGSWMLIGRVHNSAQASNVGAYLAISAYANDTTTDHVEGRTVVRTNSLTANKETTMSIGPIFVDLAADQTYRLKGMGIGASSIFSPGGSILYGVRLR